MNELAKLQQDINVYCHELELSSKIKLLDIVDGWSFIFGSLSIAYEKNSWLYKIIRYLLLPLRPLIQGLSGTRIYQGAEIEGGLFLHHSEGVVIVDTVTIGKKLYHIYRILLGA